jgi:alcohol dehydrogenase class IV
MSGFTFQTPPNILAEPGACAKIGGLLADMGARHVLLVSDPGVVAAGLTDAAVRSLSAAGCRVTLFQDVVADPPEAVIHACVAAGQGADGVLGLGGGSAMDTAKLAAYLLRAPEPLSAIYGVGNAKGARLPLMLMPTTAGTGSEVTPIAIVTTGAAEKKGVVSPKLIPDWAVLDADLTLGLPAAVTAATGIDAMVHAIEAYTSKHKKNPLSDTLALRALQLLHANIRTACAAPANRQARADMLLGAMLAGLAFSNAPVAAVHALAYPIGGQFHVPHGVSNALMLTHVLRFNAPEAAPLYDEIAVHLGLPKGGLAMAMEAVIRDCNAPSRLRDVGISASDLESLARDAMNQTRLLVNNPRDVTYEDALKLYAQAL